MSTLKLPNANNNSLDILMTKLTQLEKAFKEERAIRISQEEELNNLKKLTIPNLEKQLEDKENLLTTAFIEKIKLEKSLNSAPVEPSKNSNSLNKIEYYQGAYNNMRKKYKELLEEKANLENSFNQKMTIEKEKISILNKEKDSLNNKAQKNLNDLKIITDSNKNLIIEFKSVNSLLEEMNKQREAILFELNFYKSELESSKNSCIDYSNRLKKIEAEFKSMSALLMETQNKLGNSNIQSHIFNVVRVGRLYESNSDIIFTKDEKGQMVLIIKYVTTSVKYTLLDIKEIKFREGEDNMIYIEFKPEKGIKTENFRTTEGAAIIKIFNDFHKKAIEQLDTKKMAAQEKKRIHDIENNISNILSFP